jgi:hypothetical protein
MLWKYSEIFTPDIQMQFELHVVTAHGESDLKMPWSLESF